MPLHDPRCLRPDGSRAPAGLLPGMDKVAAAAADLVIPRSPFPRVFDMDGMRPGSWNTYEDSPSMTGYVGTHAYEYPSLHNYPNIIHHTVLEHDAAKPVDPGLDMYKIKPPSKGTFYNPQRNGWKWLTEEESQPEKNTPIKEESETTFTPAVPEPSLIPGIKDTHLALAGGGLALGGLGAFGLYHHLKDKAKKKRQAGLDKVALGREYDDPAQIKPYVPLDKRMERMVTPDRWIGPWESNRNWSAPSGASIGGTDIEPNRGISASNGWNVPGLMHWTNSDTAPASPATMVNFIEKPRGLASLSYSDNRVNERRLLDEASGKFIDPFKRNRSNISRSTRALDAPDSPRIVNADFIDTSGEDEPAVRKEAPVKSESKAEPTPAEIMDANSHQREADDARSAAADAAAKTESEQRASELQRALKRRSTSAGSSSNSLIPGVSNMHLGLGAGAVGLGGLGAYGLYHMLKGKEKEKRRDKQVAKKAGVYCA